MNIDKKQSAFLALADRQIPRPVKARMRGMEKRRMHAAQKKAIIKALNERDMLMRLWKKWREDVQSEALEGAHGSAIEKLIVFLDSVTLDNSRRVIKFVRDGKWQKAHKDIRFLVLRLVDAKLVALREKLDLPPFDDPLPGFPPTPFQILREELR